MGGPPPASAEHLPLRIYSSADGLGSSAINKLMRDSHGFLWFSTRDGLSRFDGERFRTYHLAQGDNDVTGPSVAQILERKSGEYLILVQSGGVYRFDDHTPVTTPSDTSGSYILHAQKLSDYGPSYLFEDSTGRLWAAGVDGGLALATETETGLDYQPVPLDLPVSNDNNNASPLRAVTRIIEGRDHSFWVTSDKGLLRLDSNGKPVRFYETQPSASSPIESVLPTVFEDLSGRIWTGTRGSIFVITPDSLTDHPEFRTAPLAPAGISQGESIGEFTALDGYKSTYARSFYQTADNRLWIASDNGLWIFEHNLFKHYDSSNGLREQMFSITADTDDNLWMASSNGVVKLVRRGFSSFAKPEGLGSLAVNSIYETSAVGENKTIYAVGDNWLVSRYDGENFVANRPEAVTNELGGPLWTSNAVFPQRNSWGTTSSWWFLSEDKLLRFDNVKDFADLKSRRTPSAVFESGKEFKNAAFYRMYQTSNGDVWLSTRSLNIDRDGFYLWQPQTNSFRAFGAAENFPENKSPSAFCEDVQGNLWVGFYDGGIARYRNGKFEYFEKPDSIAASGIFALMRDHKGRIWIASSSVGVMRVDDPTADVPEFSRPLASSAGGSESLASNNARALVEDDAGRIYVGTVRGVDRIEPETGRVRHFSTADGLADDFVTVAYKDSSGALWFGTLGGLSRLIPENDPPAANAAALPSLPIAIGGVTVAGVKQNVSELGQNEVGKFDLNYAQSNLQIDFFSINFAEPVRYQYKLEGADGDWSQPTVDRNVNYANLAPGDYHFLVRAVNGDGASSSHPAMVSFVIEPPLWRKSWFIALCALLAVLMVVIIERYRAARVRELREANDELTSSEARFRRLVEQSPLGIMILEPDGTIRSANQAYLDVWGQGVTFEQLKNWDLTKDKQLINFGISEGLQRAFAGETHVFTPMRYELRLNSAGVAIPEDAREVVYIQAVAYPIKNEAGEVREVICFLEDITEKQTARDRLENARRERLAELEQVRRRIATDLHDDIGSSLTQIAVLSEVAKRQFETPQPPPTNSDDSPAPLDRISSVSNELVEAMSDIVWAINPQKDNLRDLVQRLRRFVHDVFTARDIDFKFSAPNLEENVTLGANIRREVFVICKETVNNIVKHSECRHASVEIRLAKDALLLEISDDGRGFNVARVLSESSLQVKGGNGLLNTVRRTEELGGDCEIISSPNGQGTAIKIKIPLHPIAETSSNGTAATQVGGAPSNGNKAQ